MTVIKKIALGLGIALAVLLVLAVSAYLFGGPSGPSEGDRAAYEALVADGTVSPVEDRFVVPIPGCRCHSDDPVLVVQHSERRIRDCSGCH